MQFYSTHNDRKTHAGLWTQSSEIIGKYEGFEPMPCQNEQQEKENWKTTQQNYLKLAKFIFDQFDIGRRQIDREPFHCVCLHGARHTTHGTQHTAHIIWIKRFEISNFISGNSIYCPSTQHHRQTMHKQWPQIKNTTKWLVLLGKKNSVYFSC